MDKYKNKDGIELSFTGNDTTSVLTREVISEAIKILNMYDRSCKISMGMAMMNTKKFLKTNFNIENWDLKKEIGGKVVRENYDIRLGVEMYSNLIKVGMV